MTREGVTARALEGGWQAGEKRETVAAASSSVTYPHGICVPGSRSSRQPSGRHADNEVLPNDREGTWGTWGALGSANVLHGLVFVLLVFVISLKRLVMPVLASY